MRALIATALAVMVARGALRAQVVETPIAFDSARRVLAVTPAVAERFRLAVPVWPVRGEYREARLYSIDPGGGFVLVAQRPSGALERFALTTDQRLALRAAIDASMSTVGRPTADVAADVVSEPAGSAFARHQTLLGAVAYGPMAASLADGESGASALYLLTTGASFFISYSAAQSTAFTRAQSDLAGNLGLAAGAGGVLLGYAATGNTDKGVRAVSLGAALVGTVVGVDLGRTLSDAEAHAATLGIEAGAATALTGLSMAGASKRASATAIAMVGAAGYPIGVRYPRRASYTVTAGDVDATSTTGLAGVLVAGTALSTIDDPSDKQTAAILGSGYLAGLLVGDWMLARRYDLTRSQANIIGVGAFAGALIGVAIPVLGSADDATVLLGAAATGSILGMSGLAASFPPSARATARVGDARGERHGSRPARAQLELKPTSLAAVLGGFRGNHVIGRFVF